MATGERHVDDRYRVSPSAQPDRPTRPLTALLVGSLAFGITTTVTFAVAGNFFEGSYDERVARIDDHLTAWRVEWTIAMVAELVAGVGLWGIGHWFAARERGARASAALLPMAAGVIVAAAGVGRFVVSLGDAERGADPGAWLDVLAIGGVVALVVTAFVLAWLSWGSLVARWACVTAVLFAALALLTASPSAAYLPGLAAYAGSGLWRGSRRPRTN